MGNAISSFFNSIFDGLSDFFGKIAIWFLNVWKDLDYAFYVTEDLILVAGPFLGFFLYKLCTPSSAVVNMEPVVVNLPGLDGY